MRVELWFPDCDDCDQPATATVPGTPYGWHCDRHRGWVDIPIRRVLSGEWLPAVRDSAWRAAAAALRGVVVPQYRVSVGEEAWWLLVEEGWVPDEELTYCVSPA